MPQRRKSTWPRRRASARSCASAAGRRSSACREQHRARAGRAPRDGARARRALPFTRACRRAASSAARPRRRRGGDAGAGAAPSSAASAPCARRRRQQVFSQSRQRVGAGVGRGPPRSRPSRCAAAPVVESFQPVSSQQRSPAGARAARARGAPARGPARPGRPARRRGRMVDQHLRRGGLRLVLETVAACSAGGGAGSPRSTRRGRHRSRSAAPAPVGAVEQRATRELDRRRRPATAIQAPGAQRTGASVDDASAPSRPIRARPAPAAARWRPPAERGEQPRARRPRTHRARRARVDGAARSNACAASPRRAPAPARSRVDHAASHSPAHALRAQQRGACRRVERWRRSRSSGPSAAAAARAMAASVRVVSMRGSQPPAGANARRAGTSSSTNGTRTTASRHARPLGLRPRGDCAGDASQRAAGRMASASSVSFYRRHREAEGGSAASARGPVCARMIVPCRCAACSRRSRPTSPRYARGSP